ncbi:MAG: rod shape-determining protein MreD [Candidatus Brocadiales bacterium]|nr:rod shape-determining protein MreD [Candidatus Bathyanammoxibius amoris]
MLWIILIACALFISILESTTFNQIGFLGIQPDFFLIFAVLAALNLDLSEASVTACIMGLSKDILTEGPLGVNASFFIVIVILIGLLRHKVYTGNILMQLLVVLIASIIYRGGSALFMWLYYGTIAPSPMILNVFAGSAYTAAWATAPYFLFRKFRPLHLRRDLL